MYSSIFIISGPSGAGEDSVIEGLKKLFKIERVVTSTTRSMRQGLKKLFKIERVVTSTTRSMRPGEEQGKPYYFLSREEFEEKINRDELAEWAKEYNDNLYGVTKNELERVANSGRIGIWKIEYKGVMTVKEKFPEIKSIYIAPPSLEILRTRILRRDPNISEEFLEERMHYTKEWMKHENIYTYKVVNEEGKLEETVKKVAEIIKNQ